MLERSDSIGFIALSVDKVKVSEFGLFKQFRLNIGLANFPKSYPGIDFYTCCPKHALTWYDLFV